MQQAINRTFPTLRDFLNRHSQTSNSRRFEKLLNFASRLNQYRPESVARMLPLQHSVDPYYDYVRRLTISENR